MPRSSAYQYTPPPGHPPRSTIQDIRDEFRKWRLQANDEGVIGGMDVPTPTSIGGAEAMVRFQLRGADMVIQCSTWDSYDVNLRCVYLAIQSLRLNEARGIGDTMREAYLQLQAPAKARDPWEVLGVHPASSWEDIQDVYRMKAKRVHPDTGGEDADPRRFAELTDAFERIRAERNQ